MRVHKLKILINIHTQLDQLMYADPFKNSELIFSPSPFPRSLS